jgi:hypothetical protein
MNCKEKERNEIYQNSIASLEAKPCDSLGHLAIRGPVATELWPYIYLLPKIAIQCNLFSAL